MSFKKDLRIGKEGEDRLINLLKSIDLDIIPNDAKSKEGKTKYDILIKNKNINSKIEIKYDVKQHITGNVAIEYANPKSQKHSGISATEADIWVFVLKDKSIWAARVDDIKRHVTKWEDGIGFVRSVECCGDGNASIILYNKELFFNHIFFRIDNLTNEELMVIIEILGK